MKKFTISGNAGPIASAGKLINIGEGIAFPVDFNQASLDEHDLDAKLGSHVLVHVRIPSKGSCRIDVSAVTHDHVTELFRMRRGHEDEAWDEVLYLAEAGAQIRIGLAEDWEDCRDATNWAELVGIPDDLVPLHVPISAAI